MRYQRFLVIALMSTALAVPASIALAGDEASNKCSAMRNVVINDAFVTSARVVAATDKLPEYCEVRATALPSIGIEVRLPTEDWNGKYYQAGCGGFCGQLLVGETSGTFVNAMWPGLARGYATAVTDSGHFGLGSTDATWADGAPDLERDWGYRSIAETKRVASPLIEAYYGKKEEQSIFQGCSTGGRQGLMAALRYPDLFQGIVAGAPVISETALAGPVLAWQSQANTGPDGQTILKPGKDMLVGDEVLRQCDAIDGTEDGLIADPRNCTVDLSTITCGSGDSGNQCLTPEEVAVIEKWWQPPVNSKGEPLYAGGVPVGAEPYWWLWLTGNEKGAVALNPVFAKQFGAYMAFDDDPGWSYDSLKFDLDVDSYRMQNSAAMYDLPSADLSKFREAGGKLLIWHGWADAIVPTLMTVDWYEKAAEAAGGTDVLAENAKLYLIPGMDHCGILPNPRTGMDRNSLDPIAALETWMSTGVAPESIVVEKK